MKMQKGTIYPAIRHDVASYLFSGTAVTPVRGKAAPPAGVQPKPVARLPFITRESQWVRFADQFFYLRKEGLYRFWDWGKARWEEQWARPEILNQRKRYACVILFRKDILTLLSALATIHVHGTLHRGLPFKDQRAAARRGLLSLTCGYISGFCRKMLEDLGWQARRVSGIRTEGEYNTYDNGHTLFEFYWSIRHKWVLADVDMCQMFVKDGVYLNLGEVSGLIQDGQDFDLKPLTSTGTGRIDTSQAVTGDFPGYEQFHHGFSNPEMIKQWFRRTLAVPLISDEGHDFFFCDEPSARKKAERHMKRFAALSKEVWLERFYG